MHERFDTHHVHHRYSFRDANDELNAGIDRFENRIGSRWSGHENHRGVARSFLPRFPDRIEYRHLAIEHLTAFTRRHSGDNIRAVLHALPRMKRAGAARNSLHREARVLIDKNRHGRNDK